MPNSITTASNAAITRFFILVSSKYKIIYIKPAEAGSVFRRL